MSAPLIVTVGAGPGALLEPHEAQGWRTCAWSSVPDDPWDLSERHWICIGRVADDAGVAGVVLAAARGCGVAVECPDAVLRARLIADLERLGPVEVHDAEPHRLGDLDEDQVALLRALAGGATIAAAARDRHLSVRTAERRLAAARRALGVRTTAEAIALVPPGA